ncbi:uncharacterized protein MONBRDRAFT_26845 [Monosiga brevicollis MX1]|uniref:mitogen-activated protein kinase kinase n=1 Tax=Monosiga brevicollis TaxID=81824 RepID=A9V3P5_MONBE|nr:uncharacterized protein MONBRDRAFT_26845 [Monosiga brevicollis MX1]EDQ87740.1 predicted protein [Monosiga brevicollis MX1]|eukprot:XP_001747273.1 hypothetical protein [Monosiga brevicollis MX1]
MSHNPFQPAIAMPAAFEEVLDEGELGTITIDGTVYDIADSEWDSRTEIGNGQHGTVYRERHVPTGRVVAIKYIRDSMEPDQRNLLLSEVKLSRAFNHPNLVQYFGMNIWEGDIRLYMELCDTNLDVIMTMVKESEAFDHIPEPIVGKVAASIIAALDYMKADFSAIHRDIKPSNILLAHDGTVKVCDFGLASIMENSYCVTNVGSEPYLPPERISVDAGPTYDLRSDVWSLGVTLLELMRLEHPYHVVSRTSLYALLQAVIRDDPPPCPEYYAEPFAFLVSSCLQKQVESRPKYRKASDNGTRPALKDHEVFLKYHEADVNVAAWLGQLREATASSSEVTTPSADTA